MECREVMNAAGGTVSEGSEVRLEGPMPAWGDGILRARWDGAPAAVIQGPPSVDPAALALARARAREWVGRHRPAVLPLLGVTRVHGREGWVYARPEGVSVAVLAAHRSRLPPPAVAAGIVASTCEALLALGPEGLGHPGPHPEDVLLGEDGRVTLAGFVGPAGALPAVAADEEREPALVWRLGALLAALLSGHAPPDVVEGRAWLRNVSDRVPEALAACLSELLARDPAQRPALSEVPTRLRAAGAAELGTWTADFLPAVRRRLEAEWELPEDERENTLLPGDPDEITEESDLSLVFLADPVEEVTAASGGRAAWPRDLPEHGAIPVGVGPPPEAVTGPHRLPADLFDDEAVTVTGASPASWRGALWASVVLAILAVALGVYVVAG